MIERVEELRRCLSAVKSGAVTPDRVQVTRLVDVDQSLIEHVDRMHPHGLTGCERCRRVQERAGVWLGPTTSEEKP